jgi:hypothetical protein
MKRQKLVAGLVSIAFVGLVPRGGGSRQPAGAALFSRPFVSRGVVHRRSGSRVIVLAVELSGKCVSEGYKTASRGSA